MFISCRSREESGQDTYKAKIVDLEQAAINARDAGDWKLEANTWNEIGSLHLDCQNFLEALEAFQRQHRASENPGINDVDKAKAHSNLGQAYALQETPDHRQAVAEYDECLKLLAGKLPNIRSQVQENMIISLIELGEEEIEKAEKLLDEWHSQGKSQLDISKAISFAAMIKYKKGHQKGQRDKSAKGHMLKMSIFCFQQSLKTLETLRKEDWDQTEVLDHCQNLYLNLGKACTELGNYSEALGHLQTALTMAQQRGCKKVVCAAAQNLGIIYNHLGRYHLAINLLEKATEAAKESGSLKLQGQAWNNLATSYIFVGKFDTALDMYRQSQKMLAKTGDKLQLAKVYGNIGSVYLTLGAAKEALTYFEKNREIAVKLGTRGDQALVYTNLGVAYFKQCNYDKSLEMYEKCLEMAEDAKDAVAKAKCYSGMGNVFGMKGDPARAEEMHLQDIALCSLSDPAGEGLGCHNLGLFLKNSGKQKTAVGVLWYGLARLQQVEADLGDTLRISLFEVQKKSYCLLQELLLELGRIGEALVIAELSKARALHHLVKGGNPKQSCYPNFDACWNDHEGSTALTDLECQWQAISQMVKVEGCTLLEYSFLDDEALAVWVVSCDGTISGWNVFNRRNKDSKMDDFGARSICRLIDIVRVGMCVRGSREATRETLETEEKINHFLDTVIRENDITEALGMEENPLLKAQCRDAWEEYQEVKDWLNSLKDFSIQPLTEAIDLTLPYARSWRQLLTWNESILEKSFKINSKHGREELLKRISQHLDEDRLLKQLYDWLIRPVEKYLHCEEVLIVPHESLYMVPWAALLDDSYYFVEKYVIRICPSLKLVQAAGKQRATQKRAVIVGNPWSASRDRDLKHAEEEANAVFTKLCQVFEFRSRTPYYAGGKNATREWVLKHTKGAYWVHFACHCDLERHAIKLAEESGPSNFLSMDDVQQLFELEEGSTVVLSACDSGRGNVSGEGLIGISRSFLVAGAGAVVASLWSVRDESTKELMKQTYEHLTEGNTVAHAVQRAMVGLIRDERGYESCKYDFECFSEEESERGVYNAQGQAELKALQLLFNRGKPFIYRKRKLHEAVCESGHKAVDESGRIDEEVCWRLFEAKTYPSVFGISGPAVAKAQQISLDLGAVALAVSELYKSVDIRQHLKETSEKSCTGHEHMLKKLQDAANKISEVLNRRIDCDAPARLKVASERLRGYLDDMKAYRHPNTRYSDFWQKQIVFLDQVLSRITSRVHKHEVQASSAALERLDLDFSDYVRGLGGRGVRVIPGNRRQMRPVDWAGFLVFGARTVLTDPNAGGSFENEGKESECGASKAFITGIQPDPSVQRVQDYLRHLGYQEEVETAFAKHAVGIQALAVIDAARLTELGIGLRDHQRRLKAWALREVERTSRVGAQGQWPTILTTSFALAALAALALLAVRRRGLHTNTWCSG